MLPLKDGIPTIPARRVIKMRLRLIIEFNDEVDPSCLLDAGIEFGHELVSENESLKFDENDVTVEWVEG